MESLQIFYRDNAHEDLSLDAALCLCRKTSSRHDSCMLAKEKLHPLCAQRPPDGSSTVATTNGAYNMLPACHTLADLCKEDPDCRYGSFLGSVDMILMIFWYLMQVKARVFRAVMCSR